MNDESTEYRVELDAFSGPLDLLLFLIRRDEIDIYDIPVSRITEQYLRYLDVLSELNVNVAGEFLVMAATLMEIKSRMMAPSPEPMPEDEEVEDPRLELVRQLMEYKRFKEAAFALTDRAEQRAERFSRPGERVTDDVAPSHALPRGATLWGLVEAFSRILEQTGARGPHHVLFDNIPQERLQQELEARVREAGRLTFIEAFKGPADRGRLIGMFLALLELVRQQAILVEQPEVFGEIWLTFVPEDDRPEPDELATTAPEEAAPSEAAAAEEPLAAIADDTGELPVEEDMELPDVPEIETPVPQPRPAAGEPDPPPEGA